MLAGSRIVLTIGVVAVALLLAREDASADSLIVVRGNTAAMPVSPLCGVRTGSVAFISGFGLLERVQPGPNAREVRAAAGPRGFGLSWSAPGARAISAPLTAMRRLGKLTRHGTLNGNTDIAFGANGDRTVVWEAPEGVRLQRVGRDGLPGPRVLVRPRGDDALLDPEILASPASGATWVASYRDLAEDPMVTRVSAEGAPGRSISFPVRDTTPEGGLYDAIDDGRGGLYALLFGFEPEIIDRPGITTDDTSVDLIHVTAGGEVRRRAIGANSSGALRAHLIATRGQPTIVYHQYREGSGGIFVRRAGRKDRLTKPRLIRKTGRVDDAAASPRGTRLAVLISLSSRGRSDVLLQRLSLDGRRLRGSSRVAAMRRRSRRAASTLEGQALALTRGDDIVVRWARVPRGGFESEVEYVRVMRRRSLGPSQTLWKCRSSD